MGPLQLSRSKRISNKRKLSASAAAATTTVASTTASSSSSQFSRNVTTSPVRDVSTGNFTLPEDLTVISPVQTPDQVNMWENESRSMDVELTNLEPVPPSPSEHMIYSSGLSTKCFTKRSKFFYGLPYEKQITLLRRTENMTNTSNEFAQELADELGLSFQSVFSWLSRKRYKNLRVLDNAELTPEKLAHLLEEFENNSVLGEERALLLGHQLELPVDVIRTWFNRRILGAIAGTGAIDSPDLTGSGFDAAAVAAAVGSTPSQLSLTLLSSLPPASAASLNDDLASSSSAVSDVAAAEQIDFSTDKGEPIVFSDGISSKIAKYRNKFFYSLPYHKQIVLLKHSQYLTSNESKLARRLAEGLFLPFENVFGWLNRKRQRNLKLLKIKELTPDKSLLLEDEFKLSGALNENRALMLSYELELPVETIHSWFDRRREDLAANIDIKEEMPEIKLELSEEGSDFTSSTAAAGFRSESASAAAAVDDGGVLEKYVPSGRSMSNYKSISHKKKKSKANNHSS